MPKIAEQAHMIMLKSAKECRTSLNDYGKKCQRVAEQADQIIFEKCQRLQNKLIWFWWKVPKGKRVAKQACKIMVKTAKKWETSS